MKLTATKSSRYVFKAFKKFYCGVVSARYCLQTRVSGWGVLFLAVAFSSGCVHRGAFSDQPVVDIAQHTPAQTSSAAEDDDSFAPEIIFRTASRALGTPYTRGGSNLSGFDCSGFVQWTYKHVGITLPRTAREQAAFGTPVPRDEMQVGDIVAFRHPRRGYHTGIYVGNNMFIHSPRQRQTVRYTSLDDAYFSRTFLGARRVLPAVDAERLAEIPVPSRLVALAGKTSASDVSLKASGKSKRKASVASVRSGKSVSSKSASSSVSSANRNAKAGKNAKAVSSKSKQDKTGNISAKSSGKTAKASATTAKTSSKTSSKKATVAKNDKNKSANQKSSKTRQKSSKSRS